MQLNLTSRQTIYLFCVVVFLSTSVLGVFMNDNKVTTCCPKTTPGPVPGRIVNCTYVRARGKCREAYVLITKNRKQHCVSVNSDWMQSVLKRREGICVRATSRTSSRR